MEHLTLFFKLRNKESLHVNLVKIVTLPNIISNINSFTLPVSGVYFLFTLFNPMSSLLAVFFLAFMTAATKAWSDLFSLSDNVRLDFTFGVPHSAISQLYS